MTHFSQMHRFTDRRARYASAAGLIVLGFACGAADTHRIGGALATLFIAAGMILLVAFLLRDLGLSTSGTERRRPPRIADEAPSSQPPPSPSPEVRMRRSRISAPAGPASPGRRHTAVGRPERHRGEQHLG